MGSCVSTTRRRRRSRKLSVTARKFRRKVSAAIADAPIVRASDAANCFARHEVVHVEAPVSNVTLHLTQLQWQHSQMDAGSDPLPDVTGSTNAPQASQCKDATCLLDTVHRLRSIANAETCQDDPPEKSEDSNAASSSSCKSEECCSNNLKELQSAVPCSPRPFPPSIPSNKIQPMPATV